jgi:hypothetical protein
MGEVYLADDTKLQRQVALKILDVEVAADVDRRERFIREARAAASLNHPNIVTIHSVEDVNGQAFLTLEYIDGHTLAESLPAGGMPLDRMLPIAIALADAVGAAHQRAITHRDLKPANVMLTADAASRCSTSAWPSCARPADRRGKLRSVALHRRRRARRRRIGRGAATRQHSAAGRPKPRPAARRQRPARQRAGNGRREHDCTAVGVELSDRHGAAHHY